MDSGAVVAEQPRTEQLAGPGAPTDLVGRLQHEHVDALLGEHDGGGQPVGAGPDDDRRGHLPATATRVRGSTGMVGSSRSSQGWRLVMSLTLTQPSSISPVAASRMR
jgi:hypothetical protein